MQYNAGSLRGLPPHAFRCESMPTPLNLTYILPYDCPCFARMRNSFTSVDLSTVNLSTCNMAIYGVCILLRGSGGCPPQAFHCESMPTPLNLTYILPYDCPCFARMRYSFTSVDLSTVDRSTCQLVDLSTFCWLLFVYNTPQMCSLIIVYDSSLPQAPIHINFVFLPLI